MCDSSHPSSTSSHRGSNLPSGRIQELIHGFLVRLKQVLNGAPVKVDDRLRLFRYFHSFAVAYIQNINEAYRLSAALRFRVSAESPARSSIPPCGSELKLMELADQSPTALIVDASLSRLDLTWHA